MRDCAILEAPGEGLTDLLAALLRRKNPGGVTLLGPAALVSSVSPDLLLLSPKANASALGTRLRCRCLLTPEACGAVEAEFVVSYGLSEHSSVTLSSIGGDTLLLTLQRELPTLDGGSLERQDIPLCAEASVPPLLMLAAAASLLVLGLRPETLA
ncbi:MAG: hypothetical protein FWC62_02215 [Firmicutes bacterium]|nr:hypothetical protein [Bacillota bacterium]